MLALLTLLSPSEPLPKLSAPGLLRQPVGATRPQGWLKDELELQAKGLTGQLPYFWGFFNDSAWLGGKGTEPHQYVPYLLNGLVPLSYQVDDSNLAALRERYLGFILEAHRNSSTGWLGPDIPKQADTGEAFNYWSKYVAVEAFESYFEGESVQERTEPRVLLTLLEHFQRFFEQLSAGLPPLNASRWGISRSVDALIGLGWMLDHAAEVQKAAPGEDLSFLWRLMVMLREKTDAIMSEDDHSWEDWYLHGDPFEARVPSRPDDDGVQHLLRHGVDIGQAMKTGPLYWRMAAAQGLSAAQAAKDWQSAASAVEWAEKHLHMADGMYYADEEVDGPNSPSRGTETCSVVETMYSMRIAYEVTANISFMDRLEQIAFNSLPAAVWPDVTANVYHHASNQIHAAGPGHPGSGSGSFGYALFFCCTANVHQGWPKFLLSAVQLTASSGVVTISGYAPSVTIIRATATQESSAPDEVEAAPLVVNISGSYPFSDTAIVALSHRVDSLNLRIPCWTKGAVVSVDGGGPMQAKPCSFFTLALASSSSSSSSRSTAAVINVTFINEIRLHRWQKSTNLNESLASGGGVEVHRGALTFALRPKSTVDVTPIHNRSEGPGWTPPGEGYEPISARDVHILAGEAWNFALLESSLEFVDNNAAVPRVPFDAEAKPPVLVRGKGRQVPSWTASMGNASRQGHPAPNPLPASPLTSSSPLVDLELVPFGSTNIRIAVMPTLVE